MKGESLAPDEILQDLYKNAAAHSQQIFVEDNDIRDRIEYVCRCESNRAGVRLLMACLLAKIHRSDIDPLKPYTEIGTPDSFSGRTYDEHYVTQFVTKNRLPVNSTTAFLTPTLRNIDRALSVKHDLVGRPRDLYKKTIQILDDVSKNRIDAPRVLLETIRTLAQMRDEKLARIASLVKSLEKNKGRPPLSSESMAALLSQHLACKNASRLPVLIVAAAYQTAGSNIKERALPLNSHNAADLQTGSGGDIEIASERTGKITTIYEMKMKTVTKDDIDVAITKIVRLPSLPHNYLFVTTEPIDPDVAAYAASYYALSGGIEIAVLDCTGFVRYFLHLFSQWRTEFIDTYQKLVLAEPDSAVSQSLKEAFLSLRQAAESAKQIPD